MLRNFIEKLVRTRQQAPRVSKVPAGRRVYAIGDIHGRLDLLRKLHDLIIRDRDSSDPADNVIVYLGDYVDRGEESAQVVEELQANPMDGFECYHLMGNHEWAMLGFMENPHAYLDWLEFGGRATLGSYGVAVPDPTDPAAVEVAHKALLAKAPTTHRNFIKNLLSSHEEGDYFFAHAGVRPGVPIDKQSDRDLMTIRDDFIRSHENFGKVIVHGHTITNSPEFRCNRIGIDTGAFATGCLTCLRLEDDALYILQT